MFKLLALCNLSALEDCRQIITSVTCCDTFFRRFEFRFLACFCATHLFNFLFGSCLLLNYLRCHVFFCSLFRKFSFAPGFGPGHLLDLLLNCSEFSGHGVASEVLFFSSNFLAFVDWRALFCYYLCLGRYLRMSAPLRPAIRLHAVILTCALCNLIFDTVTAPLLHLSHLL